MPEQEQPETKSPLLKLVDTVAGTAAPQEGTSQSSSGAFLPIALIILGLVVVGFSILGIMLVMARRKAAKLAAQVRKLEEEKEQMAENEKLADNEKDRQAAVVKIGELQSIIDDRKGDLQAMQEMNKARAAEMAKISDWDDIVIVDRREQ